MSVFPSGDDDSGICSVGSGVAEFTPKNILITGGCGFIGSHVVLRLVKNYSQYKVVNYDVLDYCASTKNLEEIRDFPNYKFIEGSILSSDLVRYVITAESIDTILHFAAQTHVDHSFGNSFKFTQTNVLGTHVLLEAAKACGIRRFILVSTDEVRGDTEKCESEGMMAPTNPYAATKAAAELIAKSYHISFNLPLIVTDNNRDVTRSNNAYGPFQFPEKIIPKFACLLYRNKPCFIHGDGSNRRTYVYVEDLARAFDIVLHKGTIGTTYNISTSDELTNLEVARSLLKEFGREESEEELVQFVEDRVFNDRRYDIDPDEILRLGWAPEVSWSEGIAKTVEWYKTNQDNWMTSIDSFLTPHPCPVESKHAVL